MKKQNIIIACAVLLLVAAAAFFFLRDGRDGSDEPAASTLAEKIRRPQKRSQTAKQSSAVSQTADNGKADASPPAGDAPAESEVEPAAPQTEEERREAEETRKVDEFDALTDRWMEPSGKGVSMNDVDTFVERFRSVPKARKRECLQRALNLVPDENVMLLAGILMDKTQDRELVELVFNDVLNRNEDVKKPILHQVFKDKEHPCWADTAWILDVTGELPKKK